MVKSCPDAELQHGGSATEGGSRMANRQSWGTRLLLAIALLSAGIWLAGEARAQAGVDEARQARRAAQSFPAAHEGYFPAMDGGIALSPRGGKGRNMLIVLDRRA